MLTECKLVLLSNGQSAAKLLNIHSWAIFGLLTHLLALHCDVWLLSPKVGVIGLVAVVLVGVTTGPPTPLCQLAGFGTSTDRIPGELFPRICTNQLFELHAHLRSVAEFLWDLISAGHLTN